jgi:hypothetical protein
MSNDSNEPDPSSTFATVLAVDEMIELYLPCIETRHRRKPGSSPVLDPLSSIVAPR